MRVFITGSNGQLGRALAAHLPAADVTGCDLPDCDITDNGLLRKTILAARPEVVLHCGALTDVDGCARDPDLAFRVNGLGAQNVALACAEAGAAMLYVSTNEVFDGAASEPYSEFDAPNPTNAYGRSKRAGEWYVTQLLTRFYLVRTSWLFGNGGKNFIHKILARADAGQPLRVVTDEVASPTYVEDLAEAIVRLIGTGQFGVYHLTNAGYCSRYDLARKALELAGRDAPVEPITLADYPRPSTPPKFSALANQAAAALGIRLRPWEAAATEFLSATYHVSSIREA
jgi:dTDP-4-dehydrorhamnose reductase